MKKTVTLGILLFYTCVSLSQDTNYLDKKKFGFSPILSQLQTFDSLKKETLFFDIDKEQYNSIFYKGYFGEKGRVGSYYSLSLLFLKEVEISPTQFFNYKLILNPLLPKTHFSVHKMSVSRSNTSVVTSFETKLLKFIFPKNILKHSSDDDASELLINTDFGIQHLNARRNSKDQEGITITKITGFTIMPSYLIDAPIMLNFNNSKLSFVTKTYYADFFDDNGITNLINNYRISSKKFNSVWKLKEPRKYVNAIQFKNVEGLMSFGKIDHKCNLSEIDFFEDMVAGVIIYDSEQEIMQLLKDLKFKRKIRKNILLNIHSEESKREISKKVRKFLNLSTKMRYTIKTDYKSVKIIFFTKSDIDLEGNKGGNIRIID